MNREVRRLTPKRSKSELMFAEEDKMVDNSGNSSGETHRQGVRMMESAKNFLQVNDSK
jgi:hypothetical protein